MNDENHSGYDGAFYQKTKDCIPDYKISGANCGEGNGPLEKLVKFYFIINTVGIFFQLVNCEVELFTNLISGLKIRDIF